MDRYKSQQPTQAKQPQTNNKQTTNKQTQTSHQNKKPTAQGESVIGWPVQQRRAMNEGVIALYQPYLGMAENKPKHRNKEKPSKTSPHREVSKATQHYAETGLPPARSPEIT
jgi:hypothetical protein